MFKFDELEFNDHPLCVGVQAKYKGWSIIKCMGSKGFIMGQYEAQDPEGNIHGYLAPDQVELLIGISEADIFGVRDDEIPF